ncbi:MAG TPA: metal-dependent hydrolase [Patescibacteria group bacterium]
MVSKTHDLGAFASLITAAVLYPPPPVGLGTALAAMIFNIIGALLPDIDQASNRLWDLLPGGNFLGKILRNLFLAHRTISHSLLGLWLTYKISQWLIPQIFNAGFIKPEIIITALMIGYISHLFMDGLTEEGIPLLFPIKLKFGLPPIKRMRIKTGHWFEKWIIFPLLIVYIIGFGFLNWQSLWNVVK